MVFLDWNKKRNLALATVALAGLYLINLGGINQIFAPFMEYPIIGEIRVSTVIGIATVIIAYLIYKRRLG